MIQLDTIHMYNSSYNNDGTVHGDITFSGDFGKIKLKLTPETCAKIVELMADQIVTAVKQVATQMSVETLGVSALLEHKEQSVEAEKEIESDIPF